MIDENFLGNNGFTWFFGVVEDNNDPTKNNCVRVRAWGYHTNDRVVLPTDRLPWAQCLMPNTSPSVSENGENAFLLNGSFVVGFFLDGASAQHPMILGSVATIPEYLPTDDGFNDPDKVYPKYADEPDTPRLSRNENLDKIDDGIYLKNKNTYDVVTGAIEGSWFQPPNPYAAEYPYNHVKKTESGHVQEFDDTPGKERIHTYHKAGTFEEIHPDGSRVQKIVGDNYEIIAKDNKVYVKGICSITVDGDANIKSGGNCNIKSDGQIKIESADDLSLQGKRVSISGDTVEVDGSIVTITGSSVNIS